MAERRPDRRPTVHLAWSFDRLLDAKLQNAYAILLPDRARRIPTRTQHNSGDDHDDCSHIRAGLRRPAER